MDKIGHHKPRASVARPCWSLKSRCKTCSKNIEWFHSSKARSKLMVWSRTLAKIQSKSNCVRFMSTSTIPSLFYKHPTSHLYTILLDVQCWISHKSKATLSRGPFRLSEVYRNKNMNDSPECPCSICFCTVLCKLLETQGFLAMKRPSMRELIEMKHIQSVGLKCYESCRHNI